MKYGKRYPQEVPQVNLVQVDISQEVKSVKLTCVYFGDHRFDKNINAPIYKYFFCFSLLVLNKNLSLIQSKKISINLV